MLNSEQLKESVRLKYNEIALQNKASNQSSCCGSGGCSTEMYNIMSEDYNTMEGYNSDADLGLGCGLPTRFAKIKKGDTVIDLAAYLSQDELNQFKNSNTSIYSITVYGEKSLESAYCSPGCCN